MQQSICNAMMDEMGKDYWLISDFVEFMPQSICDAMIRRFDWWIFDCVVIMQQSICDAMMDEMGKDNVGVDWLIFDVPRCPVLIIEQSICDAVMDEMGKD